MVGVGGGLASTMASGGSFPDWVPMAVVVGFALLSVLHSNRTPPRKVEELGPAIRRAVLAGPAGALLVWGVFAIFS